MVDIDGFLAPVKAGTGREAYAAFAKQAATIFRENGATRVVEGWGDNVLDGTLTGSRRSVRAAEAETVVFS